VEELAGIVKKEREEMMVTREKIRSSKQDREKEEYQIKCEIFIRAYRSAVKINFEITMKGILFF
jgi:hypothetical protein